jgi:oligoribonuclease NrnB/cAMP/cGMP phosphodiesterase (DHH superfamily)
MEQKEYLIIYHKEDNDGVFSAAIIKRYLMETINVDKDCIDLFPSTYASLSELIKNEDEPEHPSNWNTNYEHVFMVDISFNEVNIMRNIGKGVYIDTNKVTWIDHHAPIIRLSNDKKKGFANLQGARDTHKSALLLIWQYFYDPIKEYELSEQLPHLLVTLSDYDSWNWVNKYDNADYVTAVNTATTSSTELDVDKVVTLLYKLYAKDGFADVHVNNAIEAEMYEQGEIIFNYNKSMWNSLIEQNGDFEWKVITDDEVRPAICIVCQGPSTSQMFAKYKDTKYKNGIVLKWNAKTNNWGGSMYNINTDDHFHCGEALKLAFKKAGGHEGAAGFTTSKTAFNKMLINKEIVCITKKTA